MQNNSTIWILVIIGMVVIGGFWYWSAQTTETTDTGPEVNVPDETAADSSASSGQEGNDANTDNDEEESALKEFTVTGRNYEFDVTEIEVNEGDRVRITFVNDGGLHDWTLDEFNAETEQIETGESRTIEFIASDPGEYEYYCSVGNHRELGMVGTLIVN